MATSRLNEGDNTADTSSNDGTVTNNKVLSTILATSIATAVLSTATTTINPLPVGAYVDSDYASETVQAAVQKLKDSSGNIEETFKTYETIADIITEGTGVGGMINYGTLIFFWFCSFSFGFEDF